MKEDINSILFVSLSCVGDAVMTTPVLQSLHDRFPGATMDIVSDRRSAILYTYCPYKGKIYIKDKQKFLRGSWDLLSEIRNVNYDLIVDLRTDGLAYLFRGKNRLTKWFARPYGKHAVEKMMGVIRSVHRNNKIPDTTVWLGDQEERYAESVLSGLPQGPWITVVPGNANPRKVWPATKYIKLLKTFSKRLAGIVLEGSKEEKFYTDQIAGNVDLPAVNLAGKTSLLQAAAVIRRTSMFIGSDSGLGHIAGAVSTPAIILFSVDTPERVSPWRAKAGCLVSDNGHAGSITTESVIEKMDEMLSKSSTT